MKTPLTPLLILLISTSFVNLDVYAQWTVMSAPSSSVISDGYFIDENTGIAVTVYGIYKTIDGANTWDFVTQPLPQPTMLSVFFADNNTGYAAGYESGFSGVILKSSDGGENWTELSLPGSFPQFTDVYFVNSTQGCAVGYSGAILKTTNGGSSWTNISSGTTWHLESVYFTDANTGYAVGLFGTILKTTNGGTSWTLKSSGTISGFNSVHFPTASTGYAAASGGYIFKTTDAGESWTQLSSTTSEALQSIYFTSENTGYVCGNSELIMKTTDGGSIWTTENSGTSAVLTSISFVNGIGYAVGTGGLVLKSTVNAATSDLTESNAISIYPNPSIGPVNIEINTNNNEDLVVEIFNSIGQIVYTKHYNYKYSPIDIIEQIDLSNSPKGIYLLQLKTQHMTSVKKVVIQ